MEYDQKPLTPEEIAEAGERWRRLYEFEEDLMIMSVEEALARREERLRQAGLEELMQCSMMWGSSALSGKTRIL